MLEQFLRLKRIGRLEELLMARIPIGNGEGFLVPVCELMATDGTLIERLAQWRAEHMPVYPTQFTVTLAGTAAWLRSLVLDVGDRMMFLVADREGRAIGHMGFADALNNNAALRLDNVMRGVKGVQPGLMSGGLGALMTWAEDVIQPQTMYVVVFSDNERMIQFVGKLGFKRAGIRPLRRHLDGDRIVYRRLADRDDAPADKYHLKMVYRPS